MKRLSLGVVIVAAFALLSPAAASAAEYDAFVGCEVSDAPTPSHECKVGDDLGAYFEADEGTEYDTCLEFPSGGIECEEEQLAEANTLYVNPIELDTPGKYEVCWLVGGEEVEAWAFELKTPPAPPAPPAPAPVPAPVAAPLPAPILPLKSATCVKAEKRVKQLKNKLQNTDGKKQKGKVRNQLQGARGATRRSC
jgi:hypothetical protein